MCLNVSRISRTFAYNWAGDQIVSPEVSAARRVPGSKSTSLKLDVREFLAIEHSAEIRRFFFSEVLKNLQCEERERFFVGRQGNFDFRMRQVIAAFGQFEYRAPTGRKLNEWLLPAETLAVGGGSCEDLSFLLMALLEEAGISRCCLRLAFGRVVETSPAGVRQVHDHAWVMYQLEGGAWMILDPMERVEQRLNVAAKVKAGGRSRSNALRADYEYQPLFVFNRDHLWRVHGRSGDNREQDLDTYLGRRAFWTQYNPLFAMGVHESIFDSVMTGLSWLERFTVKTASLALDANVLSYDPRDHCDFAYINESWERIEKRLKTGTVADLGRACHTVADFYAHSLYAHVVPPVGNALPLYDPAQPVDPKDKQDEVFDRSKFSINNDDPALTEKQTRAYWKGKLVSGQWWRTYTTYPDDIQVPQELGPHRCLPEHDLIAVDDSTQANKPGHLYPTAAVYNRQFTLRKSAAERHVKQVYVRWCGLHQRTP